MTVKNKKWIVVLLIFPFFLKGIAQSAEEYWPVGKNNFGLKFPGPTVALGFGNKTNEVCTSVTNENGDLLFYSDGLGVFDASHRLMPNSKGLPQIKNGIQGMFTVKHAITPSVYYLFFTNSQGNGGGLQYQLIDMSLPGNGTSEQPLGNLVHHRPKVLCSSTAEAIAATRHENGKDIWLVIHESGNNVFRSFLITDTEILNGPVSKIGAQRSLLSSDAGKGSMAFSPDGRILAASFIDDLHFTGTDVIQFDRMTGQLTQMIVNIPVTEEKFDHFGVCFSPNSKLLYLSLMESGELIQFDLTAKKILKTEKVFVSKNKAAMGIPKIGPDGKLYVARLNKNYLTVIDQPDIYGLAAGFKEMGLVLPAYYHFGLGLPQSYVPDRAIALDSVTSQDGKCNGEGSIKIFAEGKNQPLYYSVDGGVNFSKSPEFTGLKPGNYFVEIKDAQGYRNMHGVVKIKNNNPIELPASRSFCISDSDYVLKANPEGGTWQGNGIRGNFFNPMRAGAGVHIIRYTLNNGCNFSSVLNLRVYRGENFEITSENTVICEDQTVKVKVIHNQTLSSCSWMINGEKLVNYFSDSILLTPPKSQCYSAYFSALDTNGCFNASYKENLICHQTKPEADFDVVRTVFSTSDSIRFINRSRHANKFKWSFGDGNFSTAVNPVYKYNTPGNYTVELLVTDESGKCTDSIRKEKLLIVVQGKTENESFLQPVFPPSKSSNGYYGTLNASPKTK